MPTVKTGYWIRVKDGQVTDVWDYAPDPARRAAEPGWREAVEVFPDMTPHREITTGHSFNLDATPAEIVWAKREVTVEERRASMIGQAKGEFQRVVQEQLRLQMNDNPAEQYDPNAVATAKSAMEAKIATLEGASTHEALDALM
jgi:hypothetical protein